MWNHDVIDAWKKEPFCKGIMSIGLIVWHLHLKKLMRLHWSYRELSNGTYGFIIDSQLEIHYDDDQRIRISDCAMVCGSGQYFYHIIVIPINFQVLIWVKNE